jgi:hypothetical protein
VELCLHSPNTPSWRGAQLKHRDNFTFTIYLHYTRGFIICFLQQVLLGYQTKEDKIGGTDSTHGKRDKSVQNYSQSEGKSSLQRPRHRQGDDIKLELKTGCECLYSIERALERV